MKTINLIATTSVFLEWLCSERVFQSRYVDYEYCVTQIKKYMHSNKQITNMYAHSLNTLQCTIKFVKVFEQKALLSSKKINIQMKVLILYY